MLLTLASVFAAMFYASQVWQLRQRLNNAFVIEHEGKGEWIMIRHGKTVVSEWEPKDGELQEVLDEALHSRGRKDWNRRS